MRELAQAVSFLTKASSMKILAGEVPKVMREGALGSLMATSCQEELAEFLRLERWSHTWVARSHSLVALIHCVELILLSIVSKPVLRATLIRTELVWELLETSTTSSKRVVLLLATSLVTTSAKWARPLVETSAITSSEVLVASEIAATASSVRLLLLER